MKNALKGWNSSNTLEQPQWTKLPFMKKLRADWRQGKLAVIRCIFCVPVCNWKTQIL